MGTVWDKVKEQAYKSIRDVQLKEEKHTHSDTYQRRCDDNEEDKKKEVVKKEKNRNITPFVPLSPRLNQ